MEFFKIKRNIPFMSYGRYTTTISLVTFILAVFFIATKGLNFGVDFTGGTVMEVHYSQPANLGKVRGQLAEMGLQAEEVSWSAMDRAVRLARLLIQHAQAAFGQLGTDAADVDAGAIVKWIRVGELTEFTRREAQKAQSRIGLR